MAKAGIEYVELDEQAQAAADVYFEAKRKKSDHDRKSANLKKQQKAALETVMSAMGDCRLAQLPDGRKLTLKTVDREVKPSKGYEYSYDVLEVLDA